MRRFLVTAFALAVSSAIAAPALACDGGHAEQPVVIIQRDDRSVLAEVGRLEVLASVNLTAASTADRDAVRLQISATRLRAEARADGESGSELIQAAMELEGKAAGLRMRAGDLRMRAGELRMRAGELRASVQRSRPPMVRSAGAPNGAQRASVRL